MGEKDGVKLIEVRVSKVIARPRSEGLWHPVGPPPPPPAPHGDEGSRAAAAPLSGQGEADTYAIFPGEFEHWVVLEQVGGSRTLPILIGIAEANAIGMVLTGMSLARPLTYELTHAMFERFGLHVRRVEIDRVERGVFYARVLVELERRKETFDARPSDALNLAIRAGAPVHVADRLLQDAAHLPPPETVGTRVELIEEQTGERIALLRAWEAPSVGRRIRLMKSTERVQQDEVSPGSSPTSSRGIRLTPVSEWEVVTIEQLEPSNWRAVASRAA